MRAPWLEVPDPREFPLLAMIGVSKRSIRYHTVMSRTLSVVRDDYIDRCAKDVKHGMDGRSQLSVRGRQQMMCGVDYRELHGMSGYDMIVTTTRCFSPSTRARLPKCVGWVLDQGRRTSRRSISTVIL